MYKPGKQDVVADAIRRRPEFVNATQPQSELRTGADEEAERWCNAYQHCPAFRRAASLCQMDGVATIGDGRPAALEKG